VAEEWVDHALNQLDVVEKAHTDVDKKLKETLAQLTEVEKAQKNAEAALNSFEKQAIESLEAQKKAKNNLALNMVELK